jgi:hypothetical protein
VEPGDLLERIAGTLRHDIGPSVGEPFAKTQAFMASVILEKLAGQIRLADPHAQADRDDRAALVHDLETQVLSSSPPRVRAAVATVRDGGDGALSGLIEALYASRREMETEEFDALLTRVRRTLRAKLDRQLDYAS